MSSNEKTKINFSDAKNFIKAYVSELNYGKHASCLLCCSVDSKGDPAQISINDNDILVEWLDLGGKCITEIDRNGDNIYHSIVFTRKTKYFIEQGRLRFEGSDGDEDDPESVWHIQLMKPANLDAVGLMEFKQQVRVMKATNGL